MKTGRAQGAPAPEGTRGQKGLAALAVILVVLCGAGAAWFTLGDGFFASPKPQVQDKAKRTANKPLANKETRQKAAPVNGAVANVSVAQASETNAPGSRDVANAGTPENDARDTLGGEFGESRAPREERPQSLADFRPASVYSGTLGEMTRLQADSQIAMADLALKEVQAKLAKLEREAQENADITPARTAAAPGDERLTNLERRVQASMDKMLSRLDEAEKNRGGGTWRVIAVRGASGRLEAELLGKDGRRLVRVGDELENGERVDEITRKNVRLAGRALPWR